MGKMVSTTVTGFRCEVRHCEARVGFEVEAGDRSGLVRGLERLVKDGWRVMLPGRLLTYCPEHAEVPLSRCFCGRLKSVACVRHGGDEVADWALWDAEHRPSQALGVAL